MIFRRFCTRTTSAQLRQMIINTNNTNMHTNNANSQILIQMLENNTKQEILLKEANEKISELQVSIHNLESRLRSLN